MSQHVFEDGTIDRIDQQMNGITVRKRIDLAEGPVAKTRFEINSTRSDPTEITLVDRIPESISEPEVGFHTDFSPEKWHVRDAEAVVFEATVDPGEDLVTMYAIKLPSRALVDELRDQPVVELSEDGAGPDDVAAAIRRIETDGDAGTPSTDGGVPDAATSGAGSSGDAATSADRVPAGDTPDDPDAAPPADRESAPGTSETSDLVASLVAELESERVDDEQHEALREALGLDVSSSFQARLRHVQERVDDLVAYRDALEAFIDENGTAQQIVVDLQEEQASMTEDLDALEATVADIDGRVDDCAGADRVEELSSSVDAVDGSLAALREDHERAVTRLDRRLDDVAGTVDELDDRLDELDATVREDLTGLRSDLETVRADVADGKEWRRSVEDAFLRE